MKGKKQKLPGLSFPVPKNLWRDMTFAMNSVKLSMTLLPAELPCWVDIAKHATIVDLLNRHTTLATTGIAQNVSF
jgi:alpha-D-ribose 1-methylphosphonate 5-triphosphate synthase subunit PhnH